MFATSSDWFIGLFVSVVIGQSNYFGSQLKTTLTHFIMMYNILTSNHSV